MARKDEDFARKSEKFANIRAASREAAKNTREGLRAKKTPQAMKNAAAVETLCATIGEPNGKRAVAKAQPRRNLEKAGIPANALDREGKKNRERRGDEKTARAEAKESAINAPSN